MRFSAMQLLAPALICLVVSGCGGSGGSTTGGGGSGNGPTTVTFNFTGGTPTAVAAKIGSGAFSAATLSSNTLTISVPNGTKNFAVAWVCPPFFDSMITSIAQNVLESTITDGVSHKVSCFNGTGGSGPAEPTGTLTLSVDASAYPSPAGAIYPNNVVIAAEDASYINDAYPNSLVSNDFNMTAPAGSDQVYIAVNNNNGPPGLFGDDTRVVAMKAFSGVSVPGTLNQGNTVTFTSADATIPEPITYKNVPAGYSTPSTYSAVYPSGSPWALDLGSVATANYLALPATIAQHSDEYLLSATTSGPASNGDQSVENSLEESEEFTSEGPATFTFPAVWGYSGPTPAALPTLDINYSGFSGQAGVTESGSIIWFQPMNFNTIYNYYLYPSVNYLNGSTSVQFPDLSGIAGFLANPATGAIVGWSASISQQNAAPKSSLFTVAAGGNYTVP